MNAIMSYWVVDANLAVNTALNLSERLERFLGTHQQGANYPLCAALVDG